MCHAGQIFGLPSPHWCYVQNIHIGYVHTASQYMHVTYPAPISNALVTVCSPWTLLHVQDAHLLVQLLNQTAAWHLGIHHGGGVEAEPCRWFLSSQHPLSLAFSDLL